MEKQTNKKQEEKNIVGTICEDRNCPFHGNLKARGRIFEGTVTKKFLTRVVIEFERRTINVEEIYWKPT